MKTKKPTPPKKQVSPEDKGITRITVCGYKSISREQSIEIRPLTLLAGANSSGKSSIMQSLLLLKQTLEAPYDPGALLLNGPNVKFTSVNQLLSRAETGKHYDTFQVGIEVAPNSAVTIHFKEQDKKGIDIQQMICVRGKQKSTYRLDMTQAEIKLVMPSYIGNLFAQLEGIVVRNRCFLEVALKMDEFSAPIPFGNFGRDDLEPYIRSLIHLPGLRGNPVRTYPVTAVEYEFPGTFENYTASVIAHWQEAKDTSRLEKLGEYLEKLGLTWKVLAERVNDTQVELRVARLGRQIKGKTRDLVSIADVGVGVSQTLPVLVALLVAEPGQMVYLEQPEIHLHPRAQSAMAEILADAAKRGVRVVVETHSDLLLLGVQTLVAEGSLSLDKVKLHWFSKRPSDGATEISSVDLDEAGAFSEDWSEDFAQVTMEAESRYLDAAELRKMQTRKIRHGA